MTFLFSHLEACRVFPEIQPISETEVRSALEKGNVLLSKAVMPKSKQGDLRYQQGRIEPILIVVE